MEEQSEVTSGPKINKNYKFKDNKPWVPVHEREAKMDDYDSVLQRKRLARPEREDDDDEECTFQPNFVSNNKSRGRSVDDLLRWGDEKRFKLANQRLNKLNGDDHSFQPAIDKNSKKLAGNREGNVEDRLLQAGENHAAKKQRNFELNQKRMFRPRINPNSKKILNKMNDELYKKDNGNTENLDFFEAVPVPTWNSSLHLSKKNQSKRSPKEQAEYETRSRYTGNDIQEAELAQREADEFRRKIAERRERKKRAREERRKSAQNRRDGIVPTEERMAVMDDKTTQYIDDYVSPYNKNMLASGLPLKSIIKKTNKKNKMSKKKNHRRGKSKGGAKDRSRSKSGRRSKSNLRGGKSNGGRRSMSRSKSQSARKPGRGNSRNNRRSNSRRGQRATSGSNRRGNLASAKGHRSHSHSERGLLPYCDKFDLKEYSKKRRQRSKQQRIWNEEVRKRNEENKFNKVKSLIYSDIYDGKRHRSKSRTKKGTKQGGKKESHGHYHPLNGDREARNRRDIGNEYMYQSLERAKGGQKTKGSGAQNEMKNIFNNLMMR